ncbi:tetratricopeptide repeat protein [Caulobacter vibrioides]|uniref:protein O-GlcNAc transferase n=2 Tax=Caulobacter vibrioides TaxID=155892 RepID=Q9ABV1_CAUVC|nr:tetratricopeptide repeat protein [Caulobacter vibrioides]YP_002515493.1 O-linked N-acetylglucosamine transferase, SPINDLY family [Caulobacter vibrioides NA1000]AAK22106.1 TPR domain protein [Caulobacter vibrioides CB15]ACL93585.1 O-linked N-acetylglucosamine transferase, SPINDLY family [Caulobacter vibrioides NA1000]ATC26953.1 tetratricopeptide repeat protein [Caulobacter vibrioides]QXZ52214.1 tetratricopeptide repeat protein [Caulobacter vibrioides]
MRLTVDQALAQAIAAHRSGQLQDAERLYRAILDAAPGHADANHNLGVLAVGVGKPQAGLSFLKAALEINPAQGQFWVSYIDALIAAGLPAAARDHLEQAKRRGLTGDAVERLEKRLDPASQPPQALLDSVVAQYRSGNLAAAESQAHALTLSFPNHELGWKVLGAVFSVTGRSEESLASMRQALSLNPQDAETFKNLAILLLKLKRAEEAEAACRSALALAPDYPQVHLTLGNALIDLARAAEAEESFRQAIRLKPDYSEAHCNLGCALKLSGRLTEAETCFRRAIQLNPADAQAHNNLGDVFKDLGRFADAEAFYRAAIGLKPEYLEAHSNLLLCLNYFETSSPDTYLAEAKQYGSVASAAATPKFSAWSIQPEPRRLRVGFISGDLNSHPVGYFSESVFQHLDRDRFELFAFPTTPKTDALTSRISPFFAGWCPIFGMDDHAAATAIHTQGVHVLVDLSGHTADNRLPVFAFRPAPVQASWLGYFATTGLPEMDYFLGDRYMVTETEQQRFTETLWRLPETWLCLAPHERSIPINPPPVLTNGFMTFGCLGNLSKMNGEVVALWSQILRAVPESKLLLKAKPFVDAQVVADIQARFAREGVSSDRLILEGPSSRAEYFETYNRIDLVLDTFPYPGGTTSVDALWMGVPVLTLAGDRFLARLGESIARNAGQSAWVARDRADYLAKAVAFASVRDVAHDRPALRRSVLTTPLFDPERFARDFGDTLWGMWSQGRSHPLRKDAPCRS